jgi:MerR family transcriptional regulator/heat shock protein HspR
MNLEGIRRVMELEFENARLREELHSARLAAQNAALDAERRQRRDLVPLRQTVAVFGERSRLIDEA